MKNMMSPLKSMMCIAGFLISMMAPALDSATIEKQANQSIQELYHRVKSMPNTSMAERIAWFSAQFKGVTYLLGSLGEGPSALYDQFPRYRIDAFDCDTYVNTVLALVLSNSLQSFQESLQLVRYHQGIKSYIHRNHFTSVDWNQNNQQKGLLKDITLEITDDKKKPVAIMANTLIDKSSWYAHKSINTIRLGNEDKIKQEKRFHELQEKGKKLGTIEAKIPYIPLTSLLIQGKPNLHLFSQIPQGAIVEIIRPNWDLREQIGTFLDVSHLGFAIWMNGQLYFRQASSNEGKVIDVPLIAYLEEANKNPTIKGINVQVVVPQEPLSEMSFKQHIETFIKLIFKKP